MNRFWKGFLQEQFGRKRWSKFFFGFVTVGLLCLLSEYRCGMNGGYYESGTFKSYRARSFVGNYQGDKRIAIAVVDVSNGKTTGMSWLVFVFATENSYSMIGTMHPYTDHLDCQFYYKDHWWSCNLHLFPPRIGDILTES